MTQKKYSEKHEVSFYHIDRRGFASITSMINFMQATVNKHGRMLNTSLDDLSKTNLTWVFSRFHIKMSRYPRFFDVITVDTWRSKSKGCFAFREFEVYDEKRNLLGVATASAALINRGTRKPVDVPAFILDQFAPELGRALQDDFEKIPCIKETENSKVFHVRMSDIDLNNHVNSTSYADWIIEALPEDILMNYIIMECEISYLAEAFYGESIISQSVPADDNTQKIFFHKLNRKGSEKPITLARTIWERADTKNIHMASPHFSREEVE